MNLLNISSVFAACYTPRIFTRDGGALQRLVWCNNEGLGLERSNLLETYERNTMVMLHEPANIPCYGNPCSLDHAGAVQSELLVYGLTLCLRRHFSFFMVLSGTDIALSKSPSV